MQQQLKSKHPINPHQVLGVYQDKLIRWARQMNNGFCTNAIIVVTPATLDFDNKKLDPGNVEVSKEGCQNLRRNGSKYCQACSDIHHGIAPRPSDTSSQEEATSESTGTGPETHTDAST